MLNYITILIVVIWCISEIVISAVSLRNRSRATSKRRDRYSFVLMWLSMVPTIGFALTIRAHKAIANGIGSFSSLDPFLNYLGCVAVIIGISIRLAAIITLKKQFTDRVLMVENHELVETGIYSIVQHPAYLGNLLSLFGFGLFSGNWLSLIALVVLPVSATIFRIRVEERELLNHFGSAYQKYKSRTKRLIPGIY